MSIPPFNKYLGIELVAHDEGTAEVAIDLAPHHLNRRGVAHGGVVTSLLDSALGGAVISAMPREWWCATTSLTTQFVAGAGEGRLTAVGRIVRRGSRVAHATGEVRDDRGRVIATAQGTWHLWPSRPSKPALVVRDRVVVRGSGERLRVGKIVCVGRNYADHVKEMGAPSGAPPVMFLKPATALLPGGGRIAIPTEDGQVHHEVEMVVVIGTTGRAIPAGDAMDHVLGFAVGLDLTLRDVQNEAKRKGQPWSLAKGFDASAPVSEVAPRDEVGDGSGLRITLAVNGKTRQEGNTSSMLHDVPCLIEEASRWMTLERGDLLFTGTPSGVGPIVPGDRVVAELDKVGTLELTVEALAGV